MLLNNVFYTAPVSCFLHAPIQQPDLSRTAPQQVGAWGNTSLAHLPPLVPSSSNLLLHFPATSFLLLSPPHSPSSPVLFNPDCSASLCLGQSSSLQGKVFRKVFWLGKLDDFLHKQAQGSSMSVFKRQY